MFTLEIERCILVVQGDAMAALAAIASRNRTHLPDAPLADAGAALAARRGIMDILSHARLRRRIVLMLFTWCSVTMVSHAMLLLMTRETCDCPKQYKAPQALVIDAALGQKLFLLG